MIRRLYVFNRKPSSGTRELIGSSDVPPRDLLHFLELQKVNYQRALEHRQAKQWTIVMGNEAGDLDSVASSIAFAWYASTHLSHLTIPLLQTPRADLPLRAENLFALSNAGITPDILLTGDDISTASGENFALVDHNRLASRFVSIPPTSSHSIASGTQRRAATPPVTESRVTAIIDHHEDEGAHTNADPRIIEPSGSCSSIITRLLKAVPGISLPPELAFLLLSAIVIDTDALREGGKALPVDHEAAAWLLPLAGFGLDEPATASSLAKDSASARALREINEVLQAKKNAIDHLSPRDLLRRDYKEYTLSPTWDPPRTLRAGLSTVPRGLKAWIGSLSGAGGAFWDACAAYMDERGLSILGVLTTWRDDSILPGRVRGRHRREQAWLVRAELGEDAMNKLWSGLEGYAPLKLKRKDGKRFACDRAGFVGRVYDQGDASATRKVTAPLLREIVEGAASSSAGPTAVK